MKNKFDWFFEYVIIHGIADEVNAYLYEKHKSEIRKIRKETYNEYVLFRLMIENLTDEEMEEIMKWNNKQIDIALVHPASMGYGLNLQDGGNIIIWYGLTWSLELYQQALARLHRQGQKQKVLHHHLITKQTVDEQIIQSLKTKEQNQDKLLEAVKYEIEKED